MKVNKSGERRMKINKMTRSMVKRVIKRMQDKGYTHSKYYRELVSRKCDLEQR